MKRIATFLGILSVAAAAWFVAQNEGPPNLLSAAVAQEPPPSLNYSHVEIPYFQAWMSSGHADLNSEAFVHWQGDDPPLVPARCGACHSSAGHADFLGLDGSAFGSVEEASEAGVLQCSTCHNEVNSQRTEVTLPSGMVASDLGTEVSCVTCHSGRESGLSVERAVEGFGEDDVMPDQGFINIHYAAAAATNLGSDGNGGYQYEGMTYEPTFEHVESFSTCQSCHDPHTLEVQVDTCASCNRNIETTEDLRTIRMRGSGVDYDGDGNSRTGIAVEVDNLRYLLMDALQAYSSEVVGSAIVYDSGAYPYWFVDTNGDGLATPDEANFGNQYRSWTPRLLKAAYNYQAVYKDPGGYAHNPKYQIQLLHDSIMDLASAMGGSSQALPRPGDAGDESAVLAQASYDHESTLSLMPALDTSMLELIHRNDPGHFDVTSGAWRHWDEDGAVPASCSTCHSADGLPFLVAHDVQIEQEIASGMKCTTCHVAEDDFGILVREEVPFPSGAVLSFTTDGDNLCATCHQGRASGMTVDRRIGDIDDDMISDALGFINVHYAPSAATIMGGDAMGGYEYAGMTYVGTWGHDDYDNAASCTSCHSAHSGTVNVSGNCADCHDVSTVEDIRSLREYSGDYDGDGVESGTYYEIANLKDMLYEAMQTYSRDVIGTMVMYDSHAYPYFFADPDGDGVSDGRYATWTPRLLRAAYNYQYASKDYGGYVHNGQYVIQLLHDSLADLGADVSAMDRPDDPF